MVKTRGLTHINLAVRDAERSVRFYQQVFGIEVYSRADGLIHAKTPGNWDVITFDPTAPHPGDARGVAHFGFRLVDPADVDQAVAEAEQAGGKLLRRGEFAPGYPYAYVSALTGIRSRSGSNEPPPAEKLLHCRPRVTGHSSSLAPREYAAARLGVGHRHMSIVLDHGLRFFFPPLSCFAHCCCAGPAARST